LRSSFFAGSAFLLFFTGFAVGFMVVIPLIKLRLTYPSALLQSPSQNKILTRLIETKVFSHSTRLPHRCNGATEALNFASPVELFNRFRAAGAR
jgi:hypothetical protein